MLSCIALLKIERKNQWTTQINKPEVQQLNASPWCPLKLNLGISLQASYILAQQSAERARKLTEDNLY